MICHICKSKVNRVYKVIKKVKIYECKICNLGFVNEQEINRLKSARTSDLAKLYDSEEYKKQESKYVNRSNRLIDWIGEYCQKGTVLDIGAGLGLFSWILSKKGKFQIDLLEPLQKPVYEIKSSKLIEKNFEELQTNKKYDLIVMLDVIEHFQDPLENLQKAKNLLGKDGILVIQTPNYKSLMARLCRDWAWWMVEDHKFFFSVKSLKKMLSKAGYSIEFLTTYEDWDDFKKNLDGNFTQIKNNLLRKSVKGIFFGLFFPFYFPFRQLIWKLEYGGLIFAIIRK